MGLLDGRKALVTGSSRGIGADIARGLAAHGAAVAVAARSDEASPDPRLPGTIRTVAEEIREAGGHAVPVRLDVRDPDSIVRAIDTTASELGGLDILVNAADLPVAAPLDEQTTDDWHAILDANLLAPTMTARAAARVMKANGYGRIVNLVSVLAARGVANTSSYAAAHAGVLAMTRALSQEWARSGITVNALQVGIYEGQHGFGDDPETVRQVARMLPAKALVKPEDVGPAVVALAADSGFITGEIVALAGAANARV